ncbi:12703_t:CDS:2 [Entrophospora sp. SA101]|nr:12703_t:CDS:2 [Entrophospora sp. SA101]
MVYPKDLQIKINKLEKINNKSTTTIDSLSKRLGKAQQAKNNYISKIRSAIQNAKQLTPNEFRNQSHKLFKKNKKEY